MLLEMLARLSEELPFFWIGGLSFILMSTLHRGAAVLCVGGAVRAGAGMVRFVGPSHPAGQVRANPVNPAGDVRPDAVNAAGKVRAFPVNPEP